MPVLQAGRVVKSNPRATGAFVGSPGQAGLGGGRRSGQTPHQREAGGGGGEAGKGGGEEALAASREARIRVARSRQARSRPLKGQGI